MADERSCLACAAREAQLTEAMVGGQSMPALEYHCTAPGPLAGQRVEGPEAADCAWFRPAERGEVAPY